MVNGIANISLRVTLTVFSEQSLREARVSIDVRSIKLSYRWRRRSVCGSAVSCSIGSRVAIGFVRDRPACLGCVNA